MYHICRAKSDEEDKAAPTIEELAMIVKACNTEPANEGGIKAIEIGNELAKAVEIEEIKVIDPEQKENESVPEPK